MNLQRKQKVNSSKKLQRAMSRSNSPKSVTKLPTLTKRIYQALSPEFSKYEILLETTASKKVGGFVISRSFEGKNQMQRQQRIWRLLEKNLNTKELNRIVGILTFTPAERQFILTE
jgi:acid stress-induced BolA-like protein IbaG/YrbA